MAQYFFLFFLFLSSTMFVGRFFLLYLKKLNVNINFLSLHLVFGLFVFGSLSLVYNFFSGISDILFTYLLIGILFISLFVILIIERNFRIIFRYLFIIFISTLFFFFYSNQLPPGYDSGLYHIPHQVLIQNEKIVIGLVNMHSRFGLSTFYNYIAAIFWKDNNFTIVSFLQSTYLIIFFVFLYELIEKKIKIFNIVVLSTLLTMPIWFRYNIPGFSLVDLSYGIFFYLSVILSLLIFVEKSHLKKTYILYFVFCCSLAFMHKSNGAQLLPLFIVTLGFCIYSGKASYSYIFKTLLIPSFIVLLWMARTIIISGCFVYPVEITCFDFSWVSKNEAAETFSVIKSWSFRGYSLVSFATYLKYILLIFIIFIFLFILKLKKIYFLSFYNKKTLLVLCSIGLVFFYTQAKPLQGFSSLITDNKNIEASFIFQKEILLIIFSNIFVVFFSIVVNNFQNFFSTNLKENIMSKIPFIFVVLYLITWIVIAPNPRFAFAGFALLAPLFIVFFFPNFTLTTSKILSNFTKIVLAIVVIKLTLFDAIMINKLNFEIKKVPESPTIKRISFGRAPVDIVKENRCWTVRNCYFSEKDIQVLESAYGYKIYVHK
tara:strand:- start:287 stop:2089 length:1803 start_codon:yes stop_codon:yes gene_type:complete